jgi:MFS family permease
MKSNRRNISILALCQALMMSTTTLTVTVSVLVGFTLAPDKAYATLPFTAQLIAGTLTTIPAAWLMARIGRKPAFLLACFFGMSAGLLCTIAILKSSFIGFVLGCILIGIFNGFGFYYRFAAADAVDSNYKSRAIAYVLAGGIIAAFVGPNMANYTKDIFGSAMFAGSFAAIIAFYILSFILLTFLKLPESANRQDKLHISGRPLSTIMKQPCFIVAVLNGMLGYGVMSLIMTATPLAMQHNQHLFSDTSFVIQWHVLGMFAPSFFTGNLIKHFGLLKIMFIGGLAGLACVAINLMGTSVNHFWLALLLLGISWNFLFIGATTMLTETYQPEERFKTQAANDFIVFSTVAIASLSAGALQHHFGWQAVNYGAIPALLVIISSLLWLRFGYKAANDFPDDKSIGDATIQTES